MYSLQLVARMWHSNFFLIFWSALLKSHFHFIDNSIIFFKLFGSHGHFYLMLRDYRSLPDELWTSRMPPPPQHRLVTFSNPLNNDCIKLQTEYILFYLQMKAYTECITNYSL